MMRKIITGLLLLFVSGSLVYWWATERSATALPATSAKLTPAEPKISGRQVVAYYFHATGRCPTCLKIESLTHHAITSKFSDELKYGRLAWKTINVEDSGNQHFIKDYQLTTKSVVLVETLDGVQKRWKRLDRVWEEIGNPESFIRYIQTELSAFDAQVAG